MSWLSAAAKKMGSVISANAKGAVKIAAGAVATVATGGNIAAGAAAYSAVGALQGGGGGGEPEAAAPITLGQSPAVAMLGATAAAIEAARAAGQAPNVQPATVLGIPQKTAAIGGALLLVVVVVAVLLRRRK